MKFLAHDDFGCISWPWSQAACSEAAKGEQNFGDIRVLQLTRSKRLVRVFAYPVLCPVFESSIKVLTEVEVLLLWCDISLVEVGSKGVDPALALGSVTDTLYGCSKSSVLDNFDCL